MSIRICCDECDWHDEYNDEPYANVKVMCVNCYEQLKKELKETPKYRLQAQIARLKAKQERTKGELRSVNTDLDKALSREAKLRCQLEGEKK